MDFKQYFDNNLLSKFEFYNYNHAVEILSQAFLNEFEDIKKALTELSITVDDLKKAGGNETNIPKKFDDVLYPLGWREIRITGDLIIHFYPRRAGQRGRFSNEEFDRKEIMGVY